MKGFYFSSQGDGGDIEGFKGERVCLCYVGQSEKEKMKKRELVHFFHWFFFQLLALTFRLAVILSDSCSHFLAFYLPLFNLSYCVSLCGCSC